MKQCKAFNGRLCLNLIILLLFMYKIFAKFLKTKLKNLDYPD